MPHPTRKTGRRPPIPGRAAVPFGRFLTAAPEHPTVDLDAGQFDYPMDLNDAWGDCVVACWDHVLQAIHTLLGGSYANLTEQQILDLYRTQNPDFDPAGTADTNGPGSAADGGMVIQTFLEHLVATGLILGFAKVDHRDAQETQAAVYLGLGLMVGCVVDQAQMTDQFDEGVWDYAPGSPEEGGHCIARVGYGGARWRDVSWAKLLQVTGSFDAHQVEELWFVLVQAHVDRPDFRAHFDLPGFAAAVKQITGGKVVIPVSPTPAPTPTPTDADQAFAAVLHPWVIERHHGGNKHAADAAKVWLAARGL
jgi:hypothetical protein